MQLYKLPFYSFFYRTIMKVSHKFNWHYATICYPDGGRKMAQILGIPYHHVNPERPL